MYFFKIKVIFLAISICSYTHAYEQESEAVCKWNNLISICEKNPEAMIQVLSNTDNMAALLMRCQYATKKSTCNNILQNTCTWENNACRISSKKLINQINYCFIQNNLNQNNTYFCKQELKNISENYIWIDQNLVRPAKSCEDADQFFSWSVETCSIMKYALLCSNQYNQQYYYCVYGDDQMQAYQLASDLRYIMGKKFSQNISISPYFLEQNLNIKPGNLQLYDRCNHLSNRYCGQKSSLSLYDYILKSSNSSSSKSDSDFEIQQQKKSDLNFGKILVTILLLLLFIFALCFWITKQIVYHILQNVQATDRTRNAGEMQEMLPYKTVDLIKSLPSTEFKNSVSHYSSDAICCICLESFKEDDVSKVLSCEHLFHKECLNEWIRSQGRAVKCPLCNKQIQILNTAQQ